jgi:hypothetical protein
MISSIFFVFFVIFVVLKQFDTDPSGFMFT